MFLPASVRAVAEMSQALRGVTKRQTSIWLSRPTRSMSLSSDLGIMNMPLPWLTRWTRTSHFLASSTTALMGSSPSVLGISMRYCAPSGKRLSETG